jgi:aminoglycoside N3'-acetyltransferase
MGVDIHRCSSMHVAESKAGIPAEVSKYFEAPEDIRRDYPDDVWYIQYGSTPADAWGKVQDEAERQGLIKRRRIGRAECILFKAKSVVGIYEEALRTDPFGLFGVERRA